MKYKQNLHNFSNINKRNPMESTENNLPGKSIEDFLKDDASQVEIHQRYVKTFGYTLSFALRVETEITVRSNQVISFEALKSKLPVFSSWTLFQIKPTALQGFLIMEPSLVFPLLDIFYGGDATSAIPEKQRRFSEIELRLTKRVAVSMLEDLQRAWEPTFPLELEFISMKSDPTDITDYFLPDDLFRLVNFDFCNQKTEFMTAGLCYPLQPKNLGKFLTHEHPQTVALILSHLSGPDEVVSALHSAFQESPRDLQADIFHRIATMGDIPPGVTKEINEVVSKALFQKREIPPGEHPGSFERAVELLKLMDRSVQEGIFQEWANSNRYDAEFSEKLKNRLS